VSHKNHNFKENLLPEENDKNKEGKLKITCEHEREKD
jgi:hypothetical protein